MSEKSHRRVSEQRSSSVERRARPRRTGSSRPWWPSPRACACVPAVASRCAKRREKRFCREKAGPAAARRLLEADREWDRRIAPSPFACRPRDRLRHCRTTTTANTRRTTNVSESPDTHGSRGEECRVGAGKHMSQCGTPRRGVSATVAGRRRVEFGCAGVPPCTATVRSLARPTYRPSVARATLPLPAPAGPPEPPVRVSFRVPRSRPSRVRRRVCRSMQRRARRASPAELCVRASAPAGNSGRRDSAVRGQHGPLVRASRTSFATTSSRRAASHSTARSQAAAALRGRYRDCRPVPGAPRSAVCRRRDRRRRRRADDVARNAITLLSIARTRRLRRNWRGRMRSGESSETHGVRVMSRRAIARARNPVSAVEPAQRLRPRVALKNRRDNADRPEPRWRAPASADAPSDKAAPWLILPVVICLSQRLSHACLSTSRTKVKPRKAH